MKSKIKNLKRFWWCFITLIALLSIYSTIWAIDTYGMISFEQILFHITEPIVGLESNLLYSFLFDCVLMSILGTFLIIIGILFLEKKIKNGKIISKIKGLFIGISVLSIILSLYFIGFFEYLLIGNKESTFIEDNYVNPSSVKINFPEKKRNLIYIYLESLESSYASINEGGLFESNLIPELTALANDNISFSDTEKLGGAYELSGTSWTAAALVAQTAGIPLKIGRRIINHMEIPYFLGGAYTLGNILYFEDYNQTIIFGSNGDFGNRKTYFEQHGYYNVYDYYYAIDEGWINEDYMVWWGYEDSKLFEFAKEEALKLSQKDEPFNLSLLTVNTHHVDGYLEDGCPKIYDQQYKNVIACSSYQVNEFIKWCQQQDFYDNTTIVVVGDHLTMKTRFFNRKDNDNRRIYNAIINSPVEGINTTNRKFSTMDMFPTTLAALGVTIDGDKLGLGTNLFSDKKTLLETYGVEKVNKELSYKSNFYNDKILMLDN